MTVYLFDNTKTVIGTVDPLHYKQRMQLNGLISHTLTAKYDPALEEAHYFGSRDIDNENIFWMYRVTNTSKQGNTIELKGIYLLFDELQGEVVRDIRPANALASSALNSILSDSQWQLGVSLTEKRASRNYYYVSKLSAFYDFLNTWGVEFKPRLTWSNGQITGRYIDLYDKLSDDYGKWFEYGDKLLTITAEQANDQIYTALIGMGKGEEVGDGYGRKIRFDDIEWSIAAGDPVDKPIGQDYVELPDATAQYGLRINIVDFPDIEDRTTLLQATYGALLDTTRPRVEFYADALETGYIEIGETVTIIRDDIGIRYKTRVFELERNFMNPAIKSFRFGDKIVVSSAERLKYTAQEIEQQETAYRSLYEINRQAIVESYINGDAFEYRLLAGNEYNLPAGTYSFDKPIDQNPTSVIYTGAGKFLIANSKLPNGEWDWRTFGDGSGLGANIITSENIVTGGLEARVIRLEDGTDAESRFVELTADGIELMGRALQADGSIQQIHGEMQILDGALQTTVTDVSNMQTAQAQMLQTQEAWTVIVQAIQEETGANTVTLEDVKKYMKFDSDFLTIGKTGSPLEVQITNEAVNFIDGGQTVAWISGQQLHIKSAVVTDDFTIGNHKFQNHSDTAITIARWIH